MWARPVEGATTVVAVCESTVEVVVASDTGGVTLIVVVVVGTVFDGMTTPEEGRETTPNDVARVGPLGWL